MEIKFHEPWLKMDVNDKLCASAVFYPGERVRCNYGIRGWIVHTGGHDVCRSKNIVGGICAPSQSRHCLSVSCLYILTYSTARFRVK
jgi:hypothetical protein